MLVELKNVCYRYGPDEPEVLKGVNMTLEQGVFAALMGHTGSGKSTLVQTINGLIKPTRGNIYIDGKEVGEDISYRDVRRRVGLVFQYPEHQLFEETVFADIAFGPRNLGLEEKEIARRVERAMEFVQLDYEFLKDRSPFGLSGGQKRRVAIAGVLAMEPELLILDEPIAGLDPRGRRQLMNQLIRLQEEYGITVLMISHRMEEAAVRAHEVFVMNEGAMFLHGSPQAIFQERDSLMEVGLELPPLTELTWQLRKQNIPVRTDLFTIEQVEEEILRYWRDTCCSKT